MRLPGFLQLHPKEEVVPESAETIDPHTHQWVEKTIAYAAPRRDLINIPNFSHEILQAALLGITTFLYECPLCHELKRETLLGSNRMQLDEMMDRTEAYGPQYVQRNGVVFILQRFQQPTTGTIPIR